MGNSEGSRFFLENGRSGNVCQSGLGWARCRPRWCGAEGQGRAECSPELSSDPLSQLQKEHLSPCSCLRPGHRLLFPISLSETFLFAVRHGDARAKETRALSRSRYGGGSLVLWHPDDFNGPQSGTVRKSYQMMQANQGSGHSKGRMRFLGGEGRVLRGRRRC